ncbi:MAG: hypothetical protein COA45_07630 [Zetaproteobacteria bacterium]|nr:MAG: hypothetical protein COA45_07630 [Zetaproteobacteria bacterium]
MHILLSIFVIMTLLLPQNSQARDLETGSVDVIMPELRSTSVVIDDNDERPVEPNIGEIFYKKRLPLTSMKERVDRLIHGIKKGVPPEFDHYGYEIRRYMSRIGSMEIFENEEYLKDQIRNVRKSAIIYDYWKKGLEQEVLDIEALLDEDDTISPGVRTAFKQNRITVRTFLISLKSWIDSNERLLLHVFNHPGIYEIYYPEIIIASPQANLEFYNNTVIKQTKLKEIRVYRPFNMMVY